MNVETVTLSKCTYDDMMRRLKEADLKQNILNQLELKKEFVIIKEPLGNIIYSNSKEAFDVYDFKSRIRSLSSQILDHSKERKLLLSQIESLKVSLQNENSKPKTKKSWWRNIKLF